ncbi:hypothetical protein FKV24_016265 [Lysobacter maris]|uniref:Uncharacterized protein n=1 Tax=Marilutibacter maris TaxID=1605891 RepID=A0A508A3R2_9GAMM|nr:hypothetical protein [Lysobacter maris]KAB8168502.1 hypothetical protein FKV24_016265 [Lysobacter maris]
MADLTSREGRCDGLLESAAGKVPEYDHDRISVHDLIELGISAAAPSSATSVLACAAQIAGRAAVSPTTDSETPVVAQKNVADPTAGDVFPFEVLDLYEEDSRPTPEDHLEQLWYLEVPEAGDEEVVREVSKTGVSSDERAMQLALEFLQEEGLYSERHLDLLADIIRQRGWSSVQHQIRGLVLAGYDIAQIYSMFQLTDAWLHCVESDTLAPERWHGGTRLTWLEAAQLLDFQGHDAELEQIADFLSSEQEVWHELRRDSGQLATFKNYLFKYRLSPRTQVSDGIWQSNLDPDDTRSFDGTRNYLYSSCWWDEPIDGGARDVRQMFGAICDPARIADWLSPDTEELY